MNSIIDYIRRTPEVDRHWYSQLRCRNNFVVDWMIGSNNRHNYDLPAVDYWRAI